MEGVKTMKHVHKTLLLFAGFLINTSIGYSQVNWKLVGPTAFPTDIVGQINGMGRISQIKFHPTDASKVYAVAATGGLWRSARVQIPKTR